MTVGTYDGTDTYYAQAAGEVVYVLVPDDPLAHFDPVDRWHVWDPRNGLAGEALDERDQGDSALAEVLNCAVVRVERMRPDPIAHISRALPVGQVEELSDDDFNRLVDEVAARCPECRDAEEVYGRALRLKGLEEVLERWPRDARGLPVLPPT